MEKDAVAKLIKRSVNHEALQALGLAEPVTQDLVSTTLFLEKKGVIDAQQKVTIIDLLKLSQNVLILDFYQKAHKFLAITNGAERLKYLLVLRSEIYEKVAEMQANQAGSSFNTMFGDVQGTATEEDPNDLNEQMGLIQLLLVEIIERAVEELSINPVVAENSPKTGIDAEKFSHEYTDGIINEVNKVILSFDTEIRSTVVEIATLNAIEADSVLEPKVNSIKTKIDALRPKLDLVDQKSVTLEKEKNRLTQLSGRYATDPESFDKINQRLQEIVALIEKIKETKNLFTKLDDLLWQKSVIILIPQIRELHDLYHDLSGAVIQSYDLTRSEFSTLTGHQKDIAATYAFCRDFDELILNLETVTSGLDQERIDYINANYLAPAKEIAVQAELKAKKSWNDHRDESFSELDRANPISLIAQLENAETRAGTGFLGLSQTALETLKNELATKKRNLDTDLNTFWTFLRIKKEKIPDNIDIEKRMVAVIDLINKKLELLSPVERIKQELEGIKNQTFLVEKDNDGVTKAYEQIYRLINDTITKSGSTAELLKVKELVLRQEFKHRVRAYSKGMVNIENQNPSGATISSYYKEVLTPFVLSRLDNILISLEAMGCVITVEAGILDKVKGHFNSASNLMFSWSGVRNPVVGMGAERKVFAGERVAYNAENHPIKGVHVTHLVRDLDDDRVIEGGNVSLGNKTVSVLRNRAAGITNPGAVISPGVNSNERSVSFNETSMGWCMRVFDKIYEEKPIVVDGIVYTPISSTSGEKITASNLHGNVSEIVNFVYSIEQDRALRLGIASRFDKHLVERAFRTHIIATMNHSYLAKSRASISDELYYMFKWLNYAPDYQIAGTGKFNYLPTAFLFGFNGFSPLDLIDPSDNPEVTTVTTGKGKVMRKMERILKEKGYLNSSVDRVRESGFDTYAFMLGPFIRLVDVSPEDGSRPNNVVLNPPLRYFPLGFETGGGSVRRPLRANEPGTAQGLILTLDDMRDTNGERLYELMDFDVMGELNVYYNQLGQNGANFLNWFLRCEESQFLANVDEAKINDMKNQAKFTLSLFPRIGNSIMWGENTQDFTRNAINRLTVLLLFVKCLIMIDRSRPSKNRWDLNTDVNQFLTNMFRRGVISEESKDVIFNMLHEAYSTGVYISSLGDKLLEQVTERAKVRS